MKLIIQRVSSATVTKTDTHEVVGKIENGLFVLLGAKKGDTKNSTELLARKLVRMRIMADEAGKMNKTVADVGGKFLVVSQFTLYANTKDGNRPSFIDAQEPAKARQLYEYFVARLREYGATVETGSFGDYMMIDTTLDGPVTIIVES
jgi:D-tyrosyl-tRNA(Tyr) deacylase